MPYTYFNEKLNDNCGKTGAAGPVRQVRRSPDQ